MKVNLPKLVQGIIEDLEKAGFKVYVVGGAVRDLIMEREVLDWDLTTSALPEESLKILEKRGAFLENVFGTVMIPDEKLGIIDVTTFRGDEEYEDGRKPSKLEWKGSLKEDLARRDFTINAMALRERRAGNGERGTELIDPFDGQKDLRNKIIRAVGKAEERFKEDGLRMMRAIRLGATLGFTIETETLEAIKKSQKVIEKISWERIRDELMKIIGSDWPADGIKLMHGTGLLNYVLPELTKAVGIEQAGHHKTDVFVHSIESLRHCPSKEPLVRLAALLHDVGKPIAYRNTKGKITFYGHEVVGARLVKKIADRLRLSSDEKELLWILVRWHMFAYSPEMTDKAIRKFVRRVGKENIARMMALRIGDRKGGGSKATSWRLTELQKRIGAVLYDPLEVRDLKIGGEEVMKILGIKPGPKVGEMLQELFEEILEDPKRNTKEYLMKRVKTFS
jgi:putative nucleotidyltransferase with HDIG domain